MTEEEAINLIWDFEDEVIRCERDGYKPQNRKDREDARAKLIAALRAMPLQDHGKDSEIERLTLELGRTRAEVVQRQDDLGRLLHAAEAKNEQQAKHIEELNAKMTCMCGSEINHSAWEGHSPVSMFDYAVEQEVERRLSRPMVAEEREAKS